MTDMTNMPPPPPPPPPPPQPPQGQPAPQQQESSLSEELAKVRSRNKLLVTVSVVLGTIFVLLAGAGYIFYTKINAVKDNLEQAFSSMPALPAAYQQGGGALGGYGQASSTAMPTSSLGLFSGGLPGAGPAAGNFDPVQAQKAAQAMQKYADRPVVKEFMADLKKLPEMNGVLDGSKANNPLAVIAMLQNAKGLNKIIPKYATRPDFIALMMEAMADPDMQPLMKGMPGMGMPAMPQGLPAAARSARGVAVDDHRQADPAGADEPDYSEGGVVLDPSTISGPSRTAPARVKKAPPPVDTD